MNELEILSRQLAREKIARKEAESIAETKSRMLYDRNLYLEDLSEQLADKEKNIRAILEATADGIIVLNTNYEVLLCNQAACRIFDYDAVMLQGKNFTDLIQLEPALKQKKTITSLFMNQQLKPLEVTALCRNKITVPVELAVSRITIRKELSIICSIRDISHRNKMAQWLHMHHDIVRILAKYESFDWTRIIKVMCEQMEMQCGAMWKVDSIQNRLKCTHTWCVADDQIKYFSEIITKKMEFSPGIGLPGRVWATKISHKIDDVQQDTNFPRAKWALNANLHAAFAFPVLFQNEVMGVVEFFMSRFYAFDDTIMRLIADISNEFGIFIAREKGQKKITELSRLAGMSEVASSVLHNVGNTLNSINISVEVMQDKLHSSQEGKLSHVSALLTEHREDLASFLVSDPRGQNISEFLRLLAAELGTEKRDLLKEVEYLKTHLDRVKKIIEMQQSMSNRIYLSEEIDLEEVFDQATHMNTMTSDHANITFIYDFYPVKKSTTDRIKLLQILINLIKNGMDALIESTTEEKQLMLCLKEVDADHFMIQVSENGIGIAPEDISKIFTSGYTTKKTGHGYGLHSSAIFAHELGGDLQVQSEGPGCGAIFTLVLPYQAPLKK